MKSVTVGLLAYHEEENLKVLLPKIISNMDSLGVDYEIEVIDTQEPTDNTEIVCQNFGVKYINQETPGFAGAQKTAIKYAEKELFLIMDCDGSHNPQYIPEIYKKYIEDDCDVVIGSRYVKGGKTFDSPTSIIMSKTLNLAYRVCLGIKAKDISTDFRLYDTKQLKQLELECVNYDVLEEILLKLKLNKSNLKIGEVPIVFEKRMFGESKRQLIPFICSYIKTLFRLTAMRFKWLKHFVIYGLIGLLGAVIDYSIFSISVGQNIQSEIANVMGACCGFAFTFLMNSFFNFKKSDKLFKRFLSYGSICLFGMLISTAGIYLLKNSLNIYLLKGILLVFVSIVQFVLNKMITYRN